MPKPEVVICRLADMLETKCQRMVHVSGVELFDEAILNTEERNREPKIQYGRSEHDEDASGLASVIL